MIIIKLNFLKYFTDHNVYVYCQQQLQLINNQQNQQMQNQLKQPSQQTSKIQSQQLWHFKMKWLGIGSIEHKQNKYQYVYRPTTNQANLQKNKGIDGIQIIPIIQYQTHEQIVLIANFRPAVGKFVLQFPAGLAQGQDLHLNARRQLEQQAGLIPYKFIEMPNPIIYSDPSKGNQSGMFFVAFINGNDPSSFVPYKRQNTQNIRCYSMKIDKQSSICESLVDFCKVNSYIFDAKTWLVCMGFDLTQKLKQINVQI